MTRRIATMARGRVALIWEPRDLWIGLYVAPDRLYFAVLTIVLRWDREPVR